MSGAVDERRLDAEVSGEMFASRLRGFVRNWAPRDLEARDRFQMELTRLMVDAMRHKSDRLAMGIAFYAEAAWAEQAMRPLGVIMEDRTAHHPISCNCEPCRQKRADNINRT